MQPEALVAATLAVSQERKSFTTNHTSILNFMNKTWLSSMLNAAILKISMGHTHTYSRGSGNCIVRSWGHCLVPAGEGQD